MRGTQLRLLGPFEVLRDGAPVAISSKKARALLAVLGVERSTARDDLAAMLWGDMAEDRARHNLRQCLSTLRKTLGGGIESDGDRLQLDGSFDVDVRELIQIADSEDEAALARVVDLYRGELVEGLRLREDPYELWVREHRLRLHMMACDALARFAEQRASRDARAEAIETYRRLTAIDPTREDAHRRLMRLYAAEGLRARAVAQFEICREMLSTRLKIEPAQETRSLHDELAAASAADSPACATPPRGSSGASHEPLPLPDKPSVAVLPFDNHSDQVEQRYFSDGITEDVIIKLSKFGSLFVIARDSSFDHRGGAADARRVGRELGVHFVLFGGVRRAGERMRVTAQLVDALTGNHVWAHHYDRELADVFDVQDELTEQIVSTLASRVEAARLRDARRKPTKSMAAYDYMLRGKDHHHRWTRADNEVAIEMFERAIGLDPDYALAMAWLACTLGQKFHFAPDPSLLPKAVELFRRAHAIDDTESECYRMFASYHMMRGELDDANHAQERALALNPNDDKTVCQMGELRIWQGRPQEAETWVRRAIRLNPYHSDGFYYPLGQALFHQERFDEARDALTRVKEPRPRELAFLVASSVHAHRVDDGRRWASALREAKPDFDVEGFATRLPYSRREDRELVIEALRQGLCR